MQGAVAVAESVPGTALQLPWLLELDQRLSRTLLVGCAPHYDADEQR